MPQALPGPFPPLQGTLRRYRHPNTELCLWHGMATSGHREVTTPEATFAPSQVVLLVALCGVGAAGMLLRAQGQSGTFLHTPRGHRSTCKPRRGCRGKLLRSDGSETAARTHSPWLSPQESPYYPIC